MKRTTPSPTTHWFITTLLRDEKGRLKSVSLLGIAVFSAAEEALQEFAAGGLAGFRVGDLQPDAEDPYA